MFDVSILSIVAKSSFKSPLKNLVINFTHLHAYSFILQSTLFLLKTPYCVLFVSTFYKKCLIGKSEYYTPPVYSDKL